MQQPNKTQYNAQNTLVISEYNIEDDLLMSNNVNEEQFHLFLTNQTQQVVKIVVYNVQIQSTNEIN